MKRYVIERSLPGVGRFDRLQLKNAAAMSTLAELSGKVQRPRSFVADDKTFCVYLAESEAVVREHAQLSGFPATKVSEIHTVIDPMTAIDWRRPRRRYAATPLRSREREDVLGG